MDTPVAAPVKPAGDVLAAAPVTPEPSGDIGGQAMASAPLKLPGQVDLSATPPQTATAGGTAAAPAEGKDAQAAAPESDAPAAGDAQSASAQPAPQIPTPAPTYTFAQVGDKIRDLLAERRITNPATGEKDLALAVDRIEVEDALPPSQSSRELPQRLYVRFHTKPGEFDLHEFRGAIVDTFGQIPELNNLLDFETPHKMRLTPAENAVEFKKALEALAAEKGVALTDDIIGWNRFASGDAKDWVEPHVKVLDSGALAAHLHVPPHMPGIAEDATSPTDFVLQNVKARGEAIKQSIVRAAQELKKEDGTAFFSPEELAQLDKLTVETGSEVDAANRGQVNLYIGTPREGVDPNTKPQDKVGESPLKRLDANGELHTLVMNAVLTAGRDATKIFPIVAGPNEMEKRLEGLGLKDKTDERSAKLFADDLLKNKEEINDAEKEAEVNLKGKIRVFKEEGKPMTAEIELPAGRSISEVIKAIGEYQPQPATELGAAEPIRPHPLGDMIGAQPAAPDARTEEPALAPVVDFPQPKAEEPGPAPNNLAQFPQQPPALDAIKPAEGEKSFAERTGGPGNLAKLSDRAATSAVERSEKLAGSGTALGAA